MDSYSKAAIILLLSAITINLTVIGLKVEAIRGGLNKIILHEEAVYPVSKSDE